MTIEEMRENIRAMIGAMDMTYKEASEKFGLNPTAIGYMLDTKRVPELHDAVKARYDEYKKQK